MKKKLLAALAALLLAQGCATRHYVIASTATNLGVEVSQHPSSQMYQANFGYKRAELALVPTNRSSKKGEPNNGEGAKDSADVIMELRYDKIFSLSGSSLYQRLAVGSKAVGQPGAALMFAKGNDGALDPDTAAAVLQSVKTVPSTPSSTTTKILPLLKVYQAASNKEAFDKVAQKVGFKDFTSIASKVDISEESVDKLVKECKSAGLIP